MLTFGKSYYPPLQLPGINNLYLVRLDINKVYTLSYSSLQTRYFSDYYENPKPITPNDVGKTIDFAILLSL